MEPEHEDDANNLYDRLAELFNLTGEWDYETRELKATDHAAYVAELERRLRIVSSFASRAYLLDDYTTPIMG